MPRKKIEPVEIFPHIWNIEPFIHRDHPKLYPYSKEYQDYWSLQDKRIIEGLWGEDSDGNGNGGWRFMPNTLYFFINLGIMIHEDKKAKTTKKMAPRLMDTGWVTNYGYTAARGFSGFEWDDEYTCHRAVREYEEFGLKEMSPEGKVFLEEFESQLITPKKGFKKYIDPITYLYQTFDEPLGKALFTNEALNMIMGGPRGYGKSWLMAHWFKCEYLISGMRDYQQVLEEGYPPIELMMMAGLTGKTEETFDKFEKINKHLETLGGWGSGEDEIMGYYHQNCVGSLATNNLKTPYTHKYKFKEGGKWKVGGSDNKIFNVVVTTRNPDAGAGPRPIVIGHEEAGLTPNEAQVSAVNQNSLRRETKFGTELVIFTGGNAVKIGDIKKKWNNIRANDCVEFPNLYSKNTKPIGCFIPKTHVKMKFKDPNGNTNVELALAQELHTRKQKADAGDSNVLNSWIVYNCLTPDEMFGASKGNIFPGQIISERIFEIESNMTDYRRKWKIGQFTESPDLGLQFIASEDYGEHNLYWNPFDDEKKDNDLGVEIFQRPIPNDNEDVFIFNPYKITLDAVKDDIGGTSLTSIKVYKGTSPGMQIDEFTDNIVASYTGRTYNVEDSYLIAIWLAKYYKAKVLFENNIYDFAKWCYRNGYGEYLQPTPWLAIDKQIKDASRKYKVGVNIQGELKNYCLRLLKIKSTEDFVETIGEETKSTKWVSRLHDLRLLYEMQFFGELDNYDAISSALVLMIWLDQEKDPRLLKFLNKQQSESTFLDKLVAKKEDNYEFSWGKY